MADSDDSNDEPVTEAPAAPDADPEDGDDAEASEPDVADDPADDAAPVAAPRRRSLGPTMLLLGGGLWVVAAALRCSSPAGPSAAVTVDPEPAAAQADAAPTPAEADAPEAGTPMAAADADLDADADPEAPEEEEDLEPAGPADWAQATPPDVVKYEIRRGGSAKIVANLFKIFHHEMMALNPGVDLDAELAPGTKLVVYRREPDAISESVGLPSAGSLVGGVPMVDGPGRELKAIPWKSWATADTVATLDKVLDQWAARGHAQPVLVGNMSSREGGRLQPHSTHQSGRDVDISYIQRLPSGEELNWREMTADNLDAAETWALLKLLRESGKVELVFIDRSVQELLYDWARKEGGMSKRQLTRWMEYPRAGPINGAFIQHVPGHVDHIHVRFACPPDQKRCKSKRR